MANANPFGNFEGRKSRMVLRGTNTPVAEGAKNFGFTRTGSIQTSGRGLRPNARNLDGGRGEDLFGRNGEINASSNRELIQKIAALVNGNQDGGGRGGTADRLFERQTTDAYQAHLQRYEEAIRVARAGGKQGFMVLGEVLGEEVYETLGREGFARNTMMVRDLGDKEVGRIRVRKKDVVAQISTTNIHTTRVMVRQFWVYPGEYYLTGYASMEEKEIAQAGSELLDDKYQDLLEQIMVQEDTHIKGQWDDTVGTFNPLLTFNTFTPLFFSQGKINVDHWGIPCTRCVMAWDLWNDIAAEPEFANWFDPVTKHELILEGKIGSLMDVQIITDAFRYDTLRVLNDGEIYFLGPQIAVGTITQRRPLQAEPTNRYNFGQPERGWYMFQIQGDAVFPRAISKAARVSS